MSGRKFGGGAGGSKATSNLQYTKNEPSFLKKLKAQVGYKDESANLEDKIQDPNAGLDDDDARDDKDDEQPTVVVLKDGDLTAEQADALARGEEIHSDVPPPDGRVMFRRPKKREIGAAPKDDEESSERSKKNTSDKGKSKKVKSSLLSFGDDEEEEDDD
ncbi:hypothetical protein TCAL_04394 [Tigriopus californicus]|uniref:DUF4604 domain-containing protein n=2 Tax=Tigriopus californicus TaxID=6832 RepID=A0A553N896_TIGCA|nr:hypothetical protein TCAL_04394 [Tigriopus californicus]